MSKPEIKKFVPPATGGNRQLTQEARAGAVSDGNREGAVSQARPGGAQAAPKSAAQAIAEMEAGIRRQRRIMNVIKSIMPIMSAIISKPGSASTPQDKAAAINRMAGVASEASALLMSSVAPDMANRGWANAEVFGACASIIANEWHNSGDVNSSQALLDPVFIESISTGLADMDSKSLKWLESAAVMPPIKNESDAASRIRLSLLKASAPLLLDINEFSFWKQHLGETGRFSENLINILASVAAENANRQADNYGMNADHRISLWQGTIARTFEIARGEYRMIATRAFAESDGAPDAKIRNAIRRAWATDEKGDIVMMVSKTADTMLRLLDGIVEKTMTETNVDVDRREDKNKAETDSPASAGVDRGVSP